MAYTIVVGVDHRSGSDLARHGELSARSGKSCAARKLARSMLAAGLEDGPVEAVGEDGRVHYTVKSLAAFARMTYVENPRPHLARWVQMVFRGKVLDNSDEEDTE